MQASRWLRLILKVTIAIGIMLIPIGPIARAYNEGFGDPPGPIHVSNYWERVSYTLMPTGVAIAILAAVLLMVIDHRSTGRLHGRCQNDSERQDGSGES
ncbi:hypothetical protein Fuma_04221 [Fuerstiella marisgermanici]|uniref:Uncharacterized protein n=1 Tax=Fuerstiella marisgermanici TaxID=1891926 RepID=A0A1P8WKK7_9PLAN|nr:hypothetical protein Fuma_04221 [Fuerstiella marisgermanici]